MHDCLTHLWSWRPVLVLPQAEQTNPVSYCPYCSSLGEWVAHHAAPPAQHGRRALVFQALRCATPVI